MESPLHRQISIKSHTTARSQITRQDGHVEGHLNCIALRHGWSRTFSITPEQLADLDYITLEVLLELPTLKLRSSSLRVFVENPPQSGTFSKIRFWKDDGSLQSVLVKQFFEQRREDNVVCLLDVRDGNQREDTGSILSGMGGLGSGRMVLKPGQAKEWYKRSRGANRSTTSVGTTGTALDGRTDDEDVDVQPPPKPAKRTSRMQALMYAIGVSNKPPAPPPKTVDEEVAEIQTEEDQLKKRGWMPPMMRNIITPKPSIRPSKPHLPKASPSSSSLASGVNPFFSRSQRSLVRSPKSSNTTAAPRSNNPSHHDLLEEDAVEVDAEELALIANDEHGQQQSPQKGNGKPSSRWKKFLPGGDERAENPFLGAKERERGEEMTGRASPNPKKGKGKTAHFQGAEVVQKPSDAFERGPSDDDVDP